MDSTGNGSASKVDSHPLSAIPVQPFCGSYVMRALQRSTVSGAVHPGLFMRAERDLHPKVARLMAGHDVNCIGVMTLSQGPIENGICPPSTAWKLPMLRSRQRPIVFRHG